MAVLAALVVMVALAAAPAAAKVYLTQPEALRLAFAGQPFERRTAFLTDEQAAEVKSRAKAPLESQVVSYYVSASTASPAAFAYFDTHVVRTLTETLMVVVGRDGGLRSVEILAFHEPEDYLPRPAWLEKFEGLPIEESYLRRGVSNVAGATLTSRAIAESARRMLAIHEVLHNGVSAP